MIEKLVRDDMLASIPFYRWMHQNKLKEEYRELKNEHKELKKEHDRLQKLVAEASHLHSLFDQYTRKWGGVLDVSSLPNEFQDILKDAGHRFTSIVDVVSKTRNPLGLKKSPGTIYFNYIADPVKIDALAFESEGHYFIGFYAGTILWLTDVFTYLLSQPDVFTQLGDPSKEIAVLRQPHATGLADAGGLYNNIKRREEWLWGGFGPRDKERVLYAHALSFFAKQWLFYHELGHIILGHIDLVREVYGRGVLWELAARRTSQLPVNISHVLEAIADRSATQMSFGHLITIDKESPLTPFALASRDNGLYLWSIATNVLLRLFSQDAKTLEEHQNLPHPHPVTRMVSNFAWISVKIDDNLSGEEAHKCKSAVLQGMLDVDEVWSRFNIPGHQVTTSDTEKYAYDLLKKVGEFEDEPDDFSYLKPKRD